MTLQLPNNNSSTPTKAGASEPPLGFFKVKKQKTIENSNPHDIKYLAGAMQNKKSTPATSALNSNSTVGDLFTNLPLNSGKPSSRNGVQNGAIAGLIRARTQKTNTPAEIRHEVYRLCGLDESRAAFYEQRGGIPFIEEVVKKVMVSEDRDELQRGIDMAKEEIESVTGMKGRVKDMFAAQ